GAVHATGAELDFNPTNGVNPLTARSGGFLTHPTILGCNDPFGQQDFIQPKPGDIPFACSIVVRPNSNILFSVDASVVFSNPVNVNTNFRDSRLDFTFTATPMPGPSPLLLFVSGLSAIAFICRRLSAPKR